MILLRARYKYNHPFISLFWSWVEVLLVLGWLLSTANRVFHSKISISTLSAHHRLEWNLRVKLMMGGFEPPVTEASNRSTRCTKNFQLQDVFTKIRGKQTRIIPAMAPCSTYPRQKSERHQLVLVIPGEVTDPL